MPTERELHAFDGKEAERPTATERASETHPHAVPCGECGKTFYVDDATYEKVRSAAAYDPGDNPFVCDRCEAEYGEDEHAR
jgi:hypothetical protein